MDNVNSEIMERRNSSSVGSDLWAKLNIPQKFSVSNLSQYGYNLAFIRNADIDPLAIMMHGNKVAVVDSEGEVNPNSSITIR